MARKSKPRPARDRPTSWWGRLRNKFRRSRRRRFRLTREGKSFVAVTIGVGFAAVNTGNNLMYLVLGLLLSMLLVSGMLSDLTLWWVRGERRASPRFFVGASGAVDLILHNYKKRFASYSLEAVDVLEESASTEVKERCYFLKTEPGANNEQSYHLVPTRRGRLMFKAIQVSTRYPFGLIEKSRMIKTATEVLVYPKRVPAAFPDVFGDPSALTIPARDVGMGTEIAGLREHRPLDEQRHVHWRRSAALGKMVVREHERDAGRRLSITIDNYCAEPDDVWRARFERTISRAASLIAQSRARNVGVEVIARGCRSPMVAPSTPMDPALRFLALLEPTADAQGFPRARGIVYAAEEVRALPEAAE